MPDSSSYGFVTGPQARRAGIGLLSRIVFENSRIAMEMAGRSVKKGIENGLTTPLEMLLFGAHHWFGTGYVQRAVGNLRYDPPVKSESAQHGQVKRFVWTPYVRNHDGPVC